MSSSGGTATRGWAVSWSYVGLPLLGASSRRSNVWLRRFRETCLFAGILRTAVSERCVLSLFKVFTFAPRDDVVVRFERLHRRVVRAASSLPRRSADDDGTRKRDQVDPSSRRSKARDSARRSVTGFCSESARSRITPRSLRVEDEPAPASALPRSSRTTVSSSASFRPFRSNSIMAAETPTRLYSSEAGATSRPRT